MLSFLVFFLSLSSSCLEHSKKNGKKFFYADLCVFFNFLLSQYNFYLELISLDVVDMSCMA